MYPVLFNLGPLPISSFGLMMAVAFVMAVVTVWRVARSYDIDEERILDLVMLTFFGGLIGARVYFVALNTDVIDELTKVIMINRYPGLSFWGGLLGGFLTLWLFSSRMRLSFWQLADFAAVGAMIGLVFGDLGCFLGGCEYGVVSNSIIATPVVGLVGKRLPVALFEALIFLFFFSVLWKQVIRFHFAGKVAANFLIIVGLVKLILEFWRGDSRFIIGWLSLGHVYSLMSIVLGLVIFYSQSKRNIMDDLKALATLPTSRSRQKVILSSIKKGWYNQKVNLTIRLSNLIKNLQKAPNKLKRRLNVKSTPDNIN